MPHASAAATPSATAPPSTAAPSTATAAPSTATPPAAAGGKSLADDVGQRREIAIVGPSAVAVSNNSVKTEERNVAPPPVRTDGVAASSDVAAELAARQMRRHRAALDACAAAATRRSPTAAGTVTLAFEIAERKVAHVTVSDDGVHDPALAQCLVEAASHFTFSLAAARFVWPVTLAAPATAAR
jgi:hypothetical protein